MGNKQSAPAVPDPTTTANAQTSSNVDTAKAQAALNNTNQVTPYGNLTYTSTTGADGIPHYTATQTLSPAQQTLLNTNQGTQQSLANTASTEAAKLPSLLDTPVDLSSSNLDNYTNTHFLGTFNQQQDRNQALLESKLASQGIQTGSAAYTNAMRDFSDQKNSALDNMLGTSQSNAQSAILAQRNQPLNEIIGLAGGTQIQSPTYTSTPQTSVAGTNVAGIAQNAYSANQANYQYQNNQTQSMLGGLFGLGSKAIMSFSDERLKEDIVKEGELADGTNVYSYDYKPETGLPQGRQLGVMAQEVAKSNPRAVVRDKSGYLKVDYREVLAKAVRETSQRRAA